MPNVSKYKINGALWNSQQQGSTFAQTITKTSIFGHKYTQVLSLWQKRYIGQIAFSIFTDWDEAESVHVRILKIYEYFMVAINSTIFIMMHHALSHKMIFAVLDVWFGF